MSESKINRGNSLDYIIAYEDGGLHPDRVIELFQHLVDTGEAWILQGRYGREAKRLIDAGLVFRP